MNKNVFASKVIITLALLSLVGCSPAKDDEKPVVKDPVVEKETCTLVGKTIVGTNSNTENLDDSYNFTDTPQYDNNSNKPKNQLYFLDTEKEGSYFSSYYKFSNNVSILNNVKKNQATADSGQEVPGSADLTYAIAVCSKDEVRVYLVPEYNKTVDRDLSKNPEDTKEKFEKLIDSTGEDTLDDIIKKLQTNETTNFDTITKLFSSAKHAEYKFKN